MQLRARTVPIFVAMLLAGCSSSSSDPGPIVDDDDETGMAGAGGSSTSGPGGAAGRGGAGGAGGQAGGSGGTGGGAGGGSGGGAGGSGGAAGGGSGGAADGGRPDASVPSDAGNGAADAAVSPDTMPGPDAAPAPPSNAVANVFVGGGSSSNIVGFRLTPNGMFTRVGTTPSSGNVGYIAVDLPRKRLFAVGGANVTAFTMDTDRGTLSRIGSGSPGMGHGDVHVSVHPSGKWLFSANYGGGTVAVIPVAENGQPGRATDSKSAGRWAHGITPHPNGRFVYVPCRGANHVAQYRFDDQAGRLTPLSPPTVSQGVGPRHIAVHPTKPWAYLVTEDNGSVVSYMIDGEGRLTQPQVTRMRDGENWGAHIVVSSDGRFVFASARRTNHILAYTIDQNTGRLTQADAVNQGIAVPRDFAIDPAGRFLAVANESAGNVVIFRIDQATGKLTRIATESAVGRAQAVGIAP